MNNFLAFVCFLYYYYYHLQIVRIHGPDRSHLSLLTWLWQVNVLPQMEPDGRKRAPVVRAFAHAGRACVCSHRRARLTQTELKVKPVLNPFVSPECRRSGGDQRALSGASVRLGNPCGDPDPVHIAGGGPSCSAVGYLNT